ncbi:MAG: type IX secretion system sortase PorU [Muribaculaceae bacterium]|nr:type IX secretion system sortase PorU [Muribaculaceae bacterium]
MHKKFLFKIMSLMAIVAATTISAQAFSSAIYTRTSKLASGRWVKIEITESGIYQLTFDELERMGFSNPENVRIYGLGGYPISEVLDGSQIDDLQQVPIKMYDNKICFYGCGTVHFTLDTPTGTPHYTREVNSYSTKGYYFVTEDENEALLEPATVNSADVANPVARTHSLDYWHHELDLVSPGESGKEMMGEDMIGGVINVPYSIPTLCTDSMVVVNINAGAKVVYASYIYGVLNTDTLNFQNIAAKIYAPANSFVYYNYASPYVAHYPTPGHPVPTDGNINVSIIPSVESASVSSAWLNYITITFLHSNTIVSSEGNQLRMGFRKMTKSDRITLENNDSTIQLWNINDPYNPTNCIMNTDDNGVLGFAPNVNTNMGQYIAFNPSKELKSISNFTEIANQNIHGLADPDMIIVTCEELMPQAERVAQMHRDNDNMVVHVLDQQKIFNEFSSGTPDAMGIRLMSKMFYDRNSNKYKHLLMFGAGNYDNRQLQAKRECTILTYEATISNDEEYSYVSDDFFGILDDNSGIELAKDYLRLGVGRIPSASIQEAESDVDKLIEYTNSPDYGPWRNDFILVADDYDNGLHDFQTEGINNIIVDELATGLMNNKVYIHQFPNDETGFAYEARKELTSKLKDGQYFMTYVGHGDPNFLTKEVQLWGADQSNNVDYPHLPILTTACCDVARFDCNQRGLIEIMFHKRDGGAIAVVTSARKVYATDNDALNQAFVKALFCYNTKGYMPTVGEAYKLCKQSFGNKTNNNKMSFYLLGDPAIKVNYPKPFFKITKINGTNVGTSVISSGAMQEITVEAKVYNPDGTTVNTNFNGDATLSIYDYKKKERDNTQRINRIDVTREIFYPQKLLTRINGRVVNGEFTAKAVIPRYILSTGNIGSVKVYAHQDDSEEMVNGSFDQLKLNSYSENNPLTVHDDTPPVIDAIYFNDEQSFSNGALIPSGSTLYIRASDDYSFNNQQMAVGNTMNLTLDGGKTTYPYVKSFATLEDEGKALAVEFPMDLQEGRHTLQYTVYDAAGNKATETISFLVGNDSKLNLTIGEEPAMTEATFILDGTFSTTPNVNIKVLDSVGNLVWSTTTTNFPYTWNLTDNSGNRVPAGVYKFYGTYKGSDIYGGTEIGQIIVIDPYRSNNDD